MTKQMQTKRNWENFSTRLKEATTAVYSHKKTKVSLFPLDGAFWHVAIQVADRDNVPMVLTTSELEKFIKEMERGAKGKKARSRRFRSRK